MSGVKGAGMHVVWAGILFGLLSRGVVLFAATDAGEERTIAVEVTAPDSGWRIQIDEVVQRTDGLFVVATLRHSGESTASVLTKVRDEVTIKAPPGIPVRTFVLGKTWRWSNKEKVVYLTDRGLIREKLKSGKRLYSAGKKPGESAGELLDCVVILKPGKDTVAMTVRAGRILKSIGGDFRGELPGVEGFRAELNAEQVVRLRAHEEVLAVDALPIR